MSQCGLLQYWEWIEVGKKAKVLMTVMRLVLGGEISRQKRVKTCGR